MTREEFLQERLTGVGGSDDHHLFNIEPYGCRRRLFAEKRNAQPDKPQDTTGPLLRGLKLEAIIAEEYAEKTGREVSELGLVRHPDVPEAIVHVDRMIKCFPPEREDPGVLEIKTAGRQVFFDMKREGLPEAYILQAQHGMFVTGAKWASFTILWPDNWQLLWFDVERDEKLIAQIKDAVQEFWVLVENGPAPDRLPLESPQCRRCPFAQQCQGAALQELMQVEGSGTERDISLKPLVDEYAQAKAIFEEAEEYLESVKSEIKASMDTRTSVEVPGSGKVLFSPNREWDVARLEAARPDIARKFKTKWDLTALGKAHPELEKDFKRFGKTRPLRIYLQ